MKHIALSTLVLSLALTGITAHADTYSIDPAHTNANFSLDHMGTTTNRGSFSELTGTVDFDPKAKTGSVDISIPMTSLQTNFKPFAEHLKGKDFFNAEQYPTAQFKSTKWVFKGNKPSKIYGNLTLLGKTQPVTLTATKFNCYDNPILKAQSCGGDFTTTIDRTKFGMNTYADMKSMRNVKIDIQIEAYKK
ncbi:MULTISPECIES: YceI family protein [unclassified Moraxella]|uniref:YceI family protein n=1 Tax=unclassified Moraxella TaxID=2685852 RepID=UPI003AF836C3